jgi:hypothetical protein
MDSQSNYGPDPVMFYLEVSVKDRYKLKPLLDFLFETGYIDFEWDSFVDDYGETKYRIVVNGSWSDHLVNVVKKLDGVDLDE